LRGNNAGISVGAHRYCGHESRSACRDADVYLLRAAFIVTHGARG
jgi:hypothetical protein